MLSRLELLESVAEIARQGWPVDTAQSIEFCSHYFKFVDDDDLANHSIEALGGLVAAHAALAKNRLPDQTNIRLLHPSRPGDSTFLLLVTGDRAFVVDSMSMAVTECGWAIRQTFHPQYQVIRDESGAITDIVHRADRQPAARAESWVAIELFPPLGESSLELARELLSRVEAGLADGAAAVEDYHAMLGRVGVVQHRLATGSRGSQISGPVGLLNWLIADNFTFLGFAEFEADATHALVPVPGSGLGIYRGELGLVVEPTFDAEPFVLTKDPARAKVHRPAYLDKIAIREISAGRIGREWRFVGLFTSAAYQEQVHEIPFVSDKCAEILARTGYDPAAHGAKVIGDTLANFPREELFQARVDELYNVVLPVSRLNERRTVRLFLRPSPDGRFQFALVYLPRDRYTTTVREAMQEVLMRSLRGRSLDFQAQVGESVLARLYFTVLIDTERGGVAVDVAQIEADLERATRTWDDEFNTLASGLAAEQRGIEFTAAYKEAFTPQLGLADLLECNALGEGHDMASVLLVRGEQLVLRTYWAEGTLTLSEAMPILSSLGANVIAERPFELNVRGDSITLYEFTMTTSNCAAAEVDRELFVAAFAAATSGIVEADSFSGLVTKAGLSWQAVATLRAICTYLRQLGLPYSKAYLARALLDNPGVARGLWQLFDAKFRPGFLGREAAVDRLAAALEGEIGQLISLDSDRMLRGILNVIQAAVRTNAFAADGPFESREGQALAIKIQPRRLRFAPDPKPWAEIFVYSPRVEGVHLRFGAVARGGLRWSDRAEDYRTEVLGLVKAQMVKNTVIVPAGAKGGFVAKASAGLTDRQAWVAEGRAAYEVFISALLSVTDNLANGKPLTPAGVVAHDGADTYLVVAADKGTTTFSDLANGVALQRGFWLGDAFASGGSNGYDHKAMGITARGAWESVKHHFFELGLDPQQADFSCVGIGDMAGDVFGNGMLSSKHIRLLAAFNHQHIFIDPDPDAAASWDERLRLSRLSGSGWGDYDPALISAGGGVFDRSSKSINLSQEAAEALGCEPGEHTPAQVVSTILAAPVDLFWNGGIGTYVRSAAESDADVGDRANDAVRITARDVRARVVAEGGNLGWTQRARVEFAANGGKINTDFVDNSAGVDTSDHEVNIKIALARAVAEGRIGFDDRNVLLASMTDDVAAHVLAHNVDQNIALANARQSAPAYVGLHDDWMNQLTADGYLDRDLEALPSSAEMRRRIADGIGLWGPELATLMAWTKIWLNDKVLASDLPEDPFVANRLLEYFPKPLRGRFAADIEAHPLRREIIATVAVNRYVNSQGISSFHRLAGQTNASPADVIRAQLATRSIFSAARFEQAVADSALDAASGTELRIELRRMVEYGTQWLLSHRPSPLHIERTVAEFRDPANLVFSELRACLPPILQARYDRRVAKLGLTEFKANDPLVAVLAGTPFADRVLSIVEVARLSGADPIGAAGVSYSLSEWLGIDALALRIEQLPQFERWDSLARAALLSDLGGLLEEGLRRSLAEPTAGIGWLASRPRAQKVRETVAQAAAGDTTFAMASVALRAVRELLA